MMMASSGGRSFIVNGAGKNLLGPNRVENEARALHTGSVRMRSPSISINRLECPIHVIRKPGSGACWYMDTSVAKGPNFRLGVVSALLVRNFHNTLKIEPVPTLVGTGFTNFSPSLTAGCRYFMMLSCFEQLPSFYNLGSTGSLSSQ